MIKKNTFFQAYVLLTLALIVLLSWQVFMKRRTISSLSSNNYALVNVGHPSVQCISFTEHHRDEIVASEHILLNSRYNPLAIHLDGFFRLSL